MLILKIFATGKDDKSFNNAAFCGATEARDKLGIALDVFEANSDSLFEPAMRSFESKKFAIIDYYKTKR